jgi:HAD domain in Swiss Army Knife RNA repair proteins
MKIVFLDFDGVLNSETWARNGGVVNGLWTLDPEAVRRLQRIIDATGAYIVVSSSWRHGHTLDELRTILRDAGLTDPPTARYDLRSWTVLDVTPDSLDGFRAREIRRWLDRNPAHQFVVLDDSHDADIDGHFVQTTWPHGLQDEHVDRAIEILNRPVGYRADVEWREPLFRQGQVKF